jgi:hypothetical protein
LTAAPSLAKGSDQEERVHAELQTFLFSPGYEYDIFSRPRGHLGIDFFVNLFDWKGSINTQGGVVLPDVS